MLPVPPLAALLQKQTPVAPVEQVGTGMGVGSLLMAPRAKFSPNLAATIERRSKALDEMGAMPTAAEVMIRGSR
jgi:hypothetical protein